MSQLRAQLRALYHGETPTAVRFRLGMLILDVVLIGFFFAAPLMRDRPAFLWADYAIAVVVAFELGARGLATPNFGRWLLRTGLIDVVVLITLMFPLQLANFAFLRVLRLWSLVHSEFFWDTIARRYDDTRWEDLTKGIATLATFLFLAAGTVYALYARQHAGIDHFIDALYFTVATVTTTGFGDITLPGATGRLLSILIMISGVTLFVRLAATLVRPHKVRFACPSCGLQRHDYDAVHCKACGVLLNIPNDED
jgi:voltage-gated potassium channel